MGVRPAGSLRRVTRGGRRGPEVPVKLWLSDKAAKAMKDVPEAMKSLSETKPADAAADAAAKDKRKAEEEAREAKKEAKKEVKEATAKADADLSTALNACSAASTKMRELEHKLGERRKDAKHCKNAVEEATKRLEDAQKLLERTKKELVRAEADVPALEAQLATDTTALNGLKETLQKALAEADGAWRAVHPRNRKKRDRRTRHAAVQLVGAPPEPEEPDADAQAFEGTTDAPEAPTA